MEVAVKKVQVETIKVKTLSICAKCSDCFSAQLKDADGRVVHEYDGYVPKFMPGEHYGDYVELEIDIETGQILNWKKPSAQEIEEFMNKDDDD